MNAARRLVSLAAAGGLTTLAAVHAACTSTTATPAGADGGNFLDGGVDAAACGACLATKCRAEREACDSECYALQACIDAVCFNLSATSAPDEGACQVYCQNLHPNGAATQLAYVNCAASEPPVLDAGPTCLPPCLGAPLDFQVCVAAATATTCGAQAASCASNPDCVGYRSCAGQCTTLEACEACSASPSGAAGQIAFEALQECLARGCMAEEWLPHF